MGFRLNRTYVLKFEGAMEGAEIRIKSTPVSVVLQCMQQVPHAELAELMTQYIESWNLEDANGDVIKIEPESILQNLEEVVMRKILLEWMRAARGISAPLDDPSTSGGQSPEESIPMDPS